MAYGRPLRTNSCPTNTASVVVVELRAASSLLAPPAWRVESSRGRRRSGSPRFGRTWPYVERQLGASASRAPRPRGGCARGTGSGRDEVNMCTGLRTMRQTQSPRARIGEQPPVVDVDVAGHHVVVRDRDRVGALGEEPPRASRADRAEPDHPPAEREAAEGRALGQCRLGRAPASSNVNRSTSAPRASNRSSRFHATPATPVPGPMNGTICTMRVMPASSGQELRLDARRSEAVERGAPPRRAPASPRSRTARVIAPATGRAARLPAQRAVVLAQVPLLRRVEVRLAAAWRRGSCRADVHADRLRAPAWRQPSRWARYAQSVSSA